MKKWTQRELRSGGVVEPSAVNDELRAQQSSMTTLDREQWDEDWVDETHLADHALHRVWANCRYSTYGEQQTQSAAADTPGNAFLSITPKLDPGAWFNMNPADGVISLTGFKGGSLLIEWSGNSYVFPPFSDTTNLEYPQNPKYLNLRILVNNTLLVERRGTAYHEHFRVFGVGNFPPGTVEVQLQGKITGVGPDDPIETAAGEEIPQVHIYSNKYCVIGRFR